MGYVPGWRSVEDLLERLGDLEHAVGEVRVVPARWEPFYEQCPCCRFALAYAWARSQLQSPSGFAEAIAFFPGEEPQATTPIERANWLILTTKSEPSQVTRRLLLAEALDLWEAYSIDWLKQVVETCARLGVQISLASLGEQVQQALLRLTGSLSVEGDPIQMIEDFACSQRRHGFGKELLRMEGWTPDTRIIVLPVDGRAHSLKREILLLDLQRVVLLKARRSVRSIPWEKITLVHLSEGAVCFEIIDEPPLVVSGYQKPEDVFKTAQEAYKSATERILQAVATKVLKTTP